MITIYVVIRTSPHENYERWEHFVGAYPTRDAAQEVIAECEAVTLYIEWCYAIKEVRMAKVF